MKKAPPPQQGASPVARSSEPALRGKQMAPKLLRQIALEFAVDVIRRGNIRILAGLLEHHFKRTQIRRAITRCAGLLQFLLHRRDARIAIGAFGAVGQVGNLGVGHRA
ncbi:hypothetical protein XAUC_03470 [Xanthomonas citri pv. aurantifolii str. ICPB 10535]|nr:hypothetical protein XAUC_03470 [Xanthomonas citri pv. aurantifolii str. ICPB 10535]